MGENMETAQMLSAVIITLRGLFKDKDRLVGVDDWDAFIGCLMQLEVIGNALIEPEQTETTAEGE
jgi:hypothetical protein